MAFQRLPLPDDCDLADWLLYRAMELLYAEFKAGLFSKEEAASQRQKMEYAWSNWKALKE